MRILGELITHDFSCWFFAQLMSLHQNLGLDKVEVTPRCIGGWLRIMVVYAPLCLDRVPYVCYHWKSLFTQRENRTGSLQFFYCDH